jgi:2',3'-cyclic-nucleotide 2'-phosphodiesterase (5'-nucleotidase family)
MAFGVLFDFTGNSNVSKVIKAADMVQEQWFIDAINCPEKVDLFIVAGHNPVRKSGGGTFELVYEAIRKVHPNTPIQSFGGHTHIRDFSVYDGMTTALESGKHPPYLNIHDLWLTHLSRALL